MAGIPNLQHTKSQFPYAFTALLVSVVCGFIPVGFGMNPWLANAIQVAGGLHFFHFSLCLLDNSFLTRS